MTEKVTELLKKKNLDAILISDGYNMRYLSGFGGATGYTPILRSSMNCFAVLGLLPFFLIA